jgi:hypothetical protein
MSWRSCCALVVAWCCALFAGCGGSGVYPVEGIVEWSDGGPAKELEGASLTFELPEKNTNSVGIVKADGTFQLMTAEPGDGALPGDYTVILLERRASAGGSQLAPTKADLRYAKRDTSDLKATVHPKKNTGADRLVLKVDKAK